MHDLDEGAFLMHRAKEEAEKAMAALKRGDSRVIVFKLRELAVMYYGRAKRLAAGIEQGAGNAWDTP
ncbi:hypothetical protein BV96_04672 [Sphingomonas paucimobilis]|nr:hypothetical protein BV96_04672 [Sphingomonas paucimobilis]